MNQLQPLSLQPLTEPILLDVVRIHRSGLGYSLNSRLGQEHLTSLYRAMARDNQSCVRVSMMGGQPIGVISGAVNGQALKSRLLRSLSIWSAARIALAFVAHPSLIHQWWEENRIGAPVYYQGLSVKAVLTAIAVDEDFQTRGVGRQLVAALERFFVEHGVRTYRLDTLVTNAAAREFYKRLSFSEVATRADSVVLLKELKL